MVWTSRNNAVASVDGAGQVTGLRSGTAWIGVSAGALVDSTRVTVTAVATQIGIIGSAERAGTTGRMISDSLTVRATDRHGSGVAGVTVTFATAGGGALTPATVVTRADGAAKTAWTLGTTTGEQTATASAAGLTGSPVTFRASATAPVPDRVAISPAFTILAVAESRTYSAVVLSTEGDTILTGSAVFASAIPGVATVTNPSGGGGVATGVSPGVAGIVASVGALGDTGTVAVLGTNSILATAFPGAEIQATVYRGDTVHVPVVLDLSRPSPNGDLGSIQLDVLFAPDVLQWVRADQEISGSVGHLRAAGRYAIAFASTQPQGSGSVRLATLVFIVRNDAPSGAVARFGLQVIEAPRTTSFSALVAPVVVGGRVRVR